jgi:hypothetical protein
MMAHELIDEPKMKAWIEQFADPEFARELAQFISDYHVVGPGVAGIHVVDALEGCAATLRAIGWGNEE